MCIRDSIYSLSVLYIFIYHCISCVFVSCSLNEEDVDDDDDDDDDGLNTAKFGRADGVDSCSRVAGG